MPFVSLADARAPLIIALDAGTSSVRALAFDSQGRAILESEEQITYLLETTPTAAPRSPPNAVRPDGAGDRRRGARLGHRPGVAAVGSTSFWHSLMGIDGAGEPTTPVLYWADTRSGA